MSVCVSMRACVRESGRECVCMCFRFLCVCFRTLYLLVVDVGFSTLLLVFDLNTQTPSPCCKRWGLAHPQDEAIKLSPALACSKEDRYVIL